MNVRQDSIWLTFDTEQSRSLLRDQHALYVPYVAPRDILGTLRTVLIVARLLRRERFDQLVSTGAAIAISAFIAARFRRVQSTYIESVARVSSPSMTGRIVSSMALARLRSQHLVPYSRRWTAIESVLHDYEPVDQPPATMHRPTKVFVTLGTIHPYRFDALVDAVLRVADTNELSITWQLGMTQRADLVGTVHNLVDIDKFRAYAEEADVVIAHGGVGTLLELFDLGISPVVAPRRQHRVEHVDDHQREITNVVSELGLGPVTEAVDLDMSHLVAAMSRRVRERSPQ